MHGVNNVKLVGWNFLRSSDFPSISGPKCNGLLGWCVMFLALQDTHAYFKHILNRVRCFAQCCRHLARIAAGVCASAGPWLGNITDNNTTRQSSAKILYSQQMAAAKIRVCRLRSSWILRHVTGCLLPDIVTTWWTYLQRSKRLIIETLYIHIHWYS
jgi:hypothetical protein